MKMRNAVEVIVECAAYIAVNAAIYIWYVVW